MPIKKYKVRCRGIVCPKCNADEWEPQRLRGKFRRWLCHKCRCAYSKAYYEAHKPEQRARERARYWRKHAEMLTGKKRYWKLNKVRLSQAKKAWYRADPVSALLRGARRRAREKGLEFALSHNVVFIPELCPVLGIPLFFGDNGHCNNSPTLDRIDSSRGYTPDNVCVISWRANALKRDGTAKEHRDIASYMDSFSSSTTISPSS